ncbi:MAG TPA: DUF2911 domain-containing protein [Gemmatimonadaceae bacterium]|nr:DUF2911 domain-containing protein [Gemmatimonadaceae bacterium]
MHRPLTYCVAAPLVALLFTAGAVHAQNPMQGTGCYVQGNRSALPRRASPLDSASVSLSGGVVKLCYGRPQARGRQVMGELVPFGQPWRLGANEATTIYVPAPARIAGVAVQPGWYSIYTVPGQTEWRIVVNRSAQRWGIPIDSTVQRADVGSGTARVQQTQSPVEQLTARLDKTGANTANLVFEWERTRVQIPVELRP